MIPSQRISGHGKVHLNVVWVVLLPPARESSLQVPAAWPRVRHEVPEADPANDVFFVSGIGVEVVVAVVGGSEEVLIWPLLLLIIQVFFWSGQVSFRSEGALREVNLESLLNCRVPEHPVQRFSAVLTFDDL